MTPAQVSTLLLVLAVVFFSLAVLVAGLLMIEYRKLRNSIPDDHITPVIRLAVSLQPGVFLILGTLLALAVGFLGGHLTWW
jgi:hypothetical protein